jgi:hypothetical protein
MDVYDKPTHLITRPWAITHLSDCSSNRILTVFQNLIILGIKKIEDESAKIFFENQICNYFYFGIQNFV